MKSQFDEFLKKAGVVIDSERARILKVLEDYVRSRVIEEVSKRITAFEKTPAEWFDFLNKKIDKIKYGFSRIEMAPSVGVGDMLKSVYDTDDNGVVDKAEDLTINNQAAEDLLKCNGSKWVRFPKGAEGEVLGISGGVLSWVTAGAGDMTKAVYDTNDNGVVDNSEKLEGSTKAQVQDHAPKAHASSHESGGADEINVAGLSGELADPQPPKAHANDHADGGADEITSALDPRAYPMLADVVANRPAAGVAGRFFWATDEGILYRDNGTGWDKVAVSDYPDLDEIPSSFTPSAHHTTHENGGADEINVAGLSGELADPQPPKTHASSHESGGADEINVAGLSGELADPQPPKAHAASHKDGGADELDASELAGALGTDGQVLKSDGAAANWEDDIASITFIIDGGGSAITTGEKGHLRIPFACEIQRVTLLADQSGSITIDIWKDTYANFPPTDADSICGGNEPAISSAQKYEDTTLSGWTKTINAGDILTFNVDSCSTITRVTIALKVKRT